MRASIFLFLLLNAVILFGQEQQTESNKSPVNLGLMFFLYDYKSPSNDIKFFEKGFGSQYDLAPVGLRFTSELKLINTLSLRFEPGVILHRPLYPNANIWEDNPEIQAPLLLKFSPLKSGSLNPYLIGGYLESFKFKKDSAELYNKRMGSFEFGIGTDLELKKSTIGFGIRFNSQISSDQISGSFYERSTQGVKSNSIMICLSFDNR